MDDRDLIQRLDACRPGSDDYRDAELAPLADELATHPQHRQLHARLQQIDRTIGASMEDVPLPPGLSQRLLASLAAAEKTVAIDDVVSPSPTPSLSPSPSTTPGISRRAWLWSAAAAASAASLAGVAYFRGGLWPGQPVITPELVQEGAIAFYNQEQPEPGRDPRKFDPDFPLSRSIVGFERYTWRRIERFLGQARLAGVAFDLVAPSGTAATLYVVPQQSPALASAPPNRPASTTGGCVSAAWNEGSWTYVLVVKGGERAYQGFVRRTTVA